MPSSRRSLWAGCSRIVIAAAIGTAGVMADGQTKSPAAAKPGGGPAPAPAVEKSKETSKDTLTIRGRVVDAEGHAVAKAQLWLPLRYAPPSQAEAVADERGEFRLTVPADWLHPATRRNGSEIWAYAAGHALAMASAYAALFDGLTEAIEIRLGPLTKTSVLVVDPDGKPVVGASVRPYRIYVPHLKQYHEPPAALARLISAVTDGKGRAVLPSVSTEHLTAVRVEAKHYGLQDEAFSGAPKDAPEKTIHLRSVGRIEGHVVADKPEWARGIKLHFSQVGDYRASAVTETDADGKFVVPHLAAGQFAVMDALDPRLPVRALLRGNVEVTAGETTTMTIELVPAVRVRGRVRMVESDKPLPDAVVDVRYGVLHQGGDVRADALGRFEALVTPGRVYANVYVAREYEQKLVQRDVAIVSVPEGVETFDLPTIEMLKAIRYEGRLIDDDGKPVAGAFIHGSDGRRSFGGAPPTDRDGKFSLIAPVDIESYRVLINGVPHNALLEKIDPLVLKLPFTVKQR